MKIQVLTNYPFLMRLKLADFAKQSFENYLEQYGPLPRKYISEMYSDNVNREYDHKYDVRLDPLTEKFMIRDSRLDIKGNDIFSKVIFEK